MTKPNLISSVKSASKLALLIDDSVDVKTFVIDIVGVTCDDLFHKFLSGFQVLFPVSQCHPLHILKYAYGSPLNDAFLHLLDNKPSVLRHELLN